MENIQEIDIIITLIVGTLLMFMMTGVIVYSVIRYQKRVLQEKETLRNVEKKYQNDLLEATIIASEKERELIAKNIHDDVGVLINVIKHNNDKFMSIKMNESLINELAITNNLLLLEINKNVTAISNDLKSPTLSKLGIIRAIEQLCTQIEKSYSVDIAFNFNELKIRFNSKTEIQLFRICKEILNNILKHSRSSAIQINLNYYNELLIIVVQYDGVGINDEDVKLIMLDNNGLGLKSIYSRVQILNGLINYSNNKIDAASVVIQIPVKEEIHVTA